MMIVSSNGEAMPASSPVSVHAKRSRPMSLHKDFLAEFNFDCSFARNVKRLLRNDFALEVPTSATRRANQEIAFQACMHSIIDKDAAEAAAVVIATIIEDMSD